MAQKKFLGTDLFRNVGSSPEFSLFAGLRWTLNLTKEFSVSFVVVVFVVIVVAIVYAAVVVVVVVFIQIASFCAFFRMAPS